MYIHSSYAGGQPITILVSLQSTEPIYRQIEDQIKAALLSGELGPGAELPSIRALAQELRVSVITIKRAYEDLEREGYILTLPARGSFVSQRDAGELKTQGLGNLRKKLEPLVAEAQALGLDSEALGAIIDGIYKEKNHG